MKKLFAYFLLFLFLFNSMGYYVVYEFNKMLVKREVRADVRNNRERWIVLQVTDPLHHPGFKRIDRHEFIFQNRMYDIVKEEKRGLVTVFTCIHDNKEEKLVSGLKKVSGNKLATILISHIIDIAITVDRQFVASSMPSSYSYLPYKASGSAYVHPGYFRPPKIS
jgi:hypothetical protein